MKRGDAAREVTKAKIIEAFGEDYVDTIDKKIYVNVQDGPGGEILQMAISMTIPKTPIGKPAVNGVKSGDGAFPSVETASTTALSAEDQAEVQRLMERLGIS